MDEIIPMIIAVILGFCFLIMSGYILQTLEEYEEFDGLGFLGIPLILTFLAGVIIAIFFFTGGLESDEEIDATIDTDKIALHSVIKMGINTTHGYNSSSSAWELTLFNATLKGETGLGFTTDVAMNETVIGSDANWYYVHFYIQDADGGVGSGFSIAQGVKTNATFEFWCYQ